MTYVPADFGLDKNGPQFAWLDQRLTLHGHTPTRLTTNLKDRVRTFQLAQGWTGTGADGLVGPKTLARLTADPVTKPTAVVELSKFKRTLPTGKPGKPTELFPLADTVGPVAFEAPVDGVTTEGTVYARDELREMDGEDKAAWSNGDERHTLTGICRVVEMPGKKTDYTPGVAFAQMHDNSDDVIILLADERGRVILEEGLGKGNGSDKTILFDGYRLGDTLTFALDAHDGVIEVTVNGHHERIVKTVEDAYWKAGCYLRGNESNATGAGRVEYDALEERHAA